MRGGKGEEKETRGKEQSMEGKQNTGRLVSLYLAILCTSTCTIEQNFRSTLISCPLILKSLGSPHGCGALG